ncbi:MAG: hypothetical protein JWQ40_2391 [Segetibacter sp.]|nr:hypothetical protein [Segetibacter sp.]
MAILCSTADCFCQYDNLEFVENKGQWDERIKFKGVMNNGAFFLQEKGFRVLQINPQDLQEISDVYHGNFHGPAKNTAAKPVIPPGDKDEIIVRSHAYDVQFVNARTPVIVADKPVNSYNNYFIGNDRSKWKGNCRIYQAINYQSIYRGIDIRYYTNEGKLKYDIIVHPGADLSQLAMKYEGVDELSVKNEQLVIKTSVGEVRELAPYAYQVDNGVKREVDCRFKVAGKLVQFAVKNYSRSSPLVIDPSLIFSTFTGSKTDNWGYTATYGTDGSFYAGGIVFGVGFPTSVGAFQSAYIGGEREGGAGGYDIGIMKFSPNGMNRVYATYIGGTRNEQPHSLVADSEGNLVIGGRSNSNDYPTKVNKGGGNYDIILTKLNSGGTELIGSIKIGGAGADGVNVGAKAVAPLGDVSIRRNYGDDARSEVLFDNIGNIWLASNTQSVDFPNTPGAFQAVSGGKQDGVIIKASADLSNILVSTFLGGNEDDAAFVLALNPSDNTIFVGGNTVSTTLPGSTTGVVYPSHQKGETDGFVSVISNDGSSILKTTFIGTDGVDMVYGIQFDKFGFPYIMGTTTGKWPVINALFSQAGGKQFIAKLKPDLSAYEYSTVFGTNTTDPNLSPIAFLVDRCENVYVSGWGGNVNTGTSYPSGGTSGLTVTADAIQRGTDNSDFYFFVLERNATKQLYGSFYGQNGGTGEHVDGGTSRFDRNGVIYQALCANCGSRPKPAFPTTPGVWSSSNPADNCNLAAVKIAFNLAGVAGSIRSSIRGVVQDTTGCVPLTVDFTDTIAQGNSYVWNFGDGSPDVTTATPSFSHTYNAIGSYRVRLVSIDSAKCNIADTAYTTIKVRTFKAFLDFLPKKLEPCDSFNYEFANTSYVLPAARAFTNTSFTWNFGDNTAPVVAGTNAVRHSFPGPGEYKIRLELTDTNFCNAPADTIKALRIATNVKAAFETPPTGCAPYTAVFKNLSAGGQQFGWNFGDGATSTTVSPTHEYTIPGNYVIKLKVIDSASCNIVDSTSFGITIKGKPVAAFTFAPNPPQENTPVNFFNSSTGATRFLWKFGDGDSLLTQSSALIQHVYNETDTFNTCLIAMNNSGCQDTVCANIAARIIPLLDVPNAFTPNGDGINDKVYVRGFGISKMIWRIYNRWGTVVFESNDRSRGWDGIYNGSLQPKEVYHYVLDVQYSDKTNIQKKGDITLLR